MNTGLIRSEVVRRDYLSCGQRDEMYRLLGDHFDGISLAQFERDLAEKNRVILVLQGSRLVGFSTLLAYETTFEGGPVSVIYSGDTIVADAGRASTALARAWITAVNGLRREYPRGPYYWLLLTSGFRTYRFLPVFWREFWPRYDVSMDARTERLLRHLATERFGQQYDPARGIVRFPGAQRLLPALAAVPAGRAANPHVAAFLARNPGHAQGDELVCLTELSTQNLTAAGLRMLAHGGDENPAAPC